MIRFVSQDCSGCIVEKEVKDSSFAEVHMEDGGVSGGGVGETREEKKANGEREREKFHGRN